ncbi:MULTISPECIES: sce7726 family protein [Listeria]|uniref:sce7726 family protein n=1 Tax=Listeria TaxID=1637 RepID=UPI000B5973B0|nr:MULTISPECIES: sce7726 family protein [Listeria]
MLTDSMIRDELIKVIRKENDKKQFRVIEELSICDGAARADVAVVNGLLHGYEIKSDHDTLERLPNQIVNYELTFEKTTIVVGKKFESKILEIVPVNWGVSVAYLNKFGAISIKKIRSAKNNKAVSTDKLLDLLWSKEIKLLLKENKIKGYSNLPKNELASLTKQCVPRKEILEYTRNILKTRVGWRADLP